VIRRLAGCALAAAIVAASAPALADPPDADPWLGRDKALHFGACAGISSAGYGLAALSGADLRTRIVFGAGSAILVGAVKEVRDLAGFGDPSWKDFTWDVIGAVVGVGIAVAIDLVVQKVSAPRAATR
jgi:putative lipoprotein